jgi:hypothetical protein
MLIPTKHENLYQNILVLGADILFLLKKRGYDIESLFQKIKYDKAINIDQYYNTLLFLWLSELIELDEYHIKIK